MDILEELQWRSLIHQSTDREQLAALLASGPQTVYIGFDPTADSLHIGSMLQLMLLRRFQAAGHRPIALVGGATGMIGDPSGKSEERQLLSPEQLAANVAGLEKQLRQFLDFDRQDGALLLDNSTWMRDWSYIEFLRDVGKNFPVGVMLAKDSVRSRLAREDTGLSYTEFSYMLLQAYDFVHLAKHHDCQVQLGGSDQWGNITAGIDLGRRMLGQQLYGLTSPLLLTSDGQKMGKTARGAIWLSREKTSPYAFYQYLINVPDADVMKCIAFLSEINREEYDQLERELTEKPGQAQRRLAESLTELVHGEAGLATAQRASQVLFGGDLEGLDAASLREIFADVPSTTFSVSRLEGEGVWVVDALRETGLVTSSGEGRRTIKEGGAYVNNQRVTDVDARFGRGDLVAGEMLVLRRGKRKYGLVNFADS